MESKFFIDKHFEEESFEYLKKSHIFYNDDMKLIAEVKQREFQKLGMDTICLINGEVKTVDIKAMASVIPTFSQELKNITSGKIGWLINDDLKTDYYLYTYHRVKDGTGNYSKDKYLLNRNNIEYTKSILVKKADVLGIIYDTLGLDKNGLKDLTEEIEKAYKKTGKTKFVYKDGELVATYNTSNFPCYFVVSKYIKEKPINCIIRRSELERVGKVFEESDEDIYRGVIS